MGESKNFISVVICTYNRCESLKDTLNSLLIQKCEGNFDYEVIVVDNNSKDETEKVVKEYEKRFKGRLKYLFEPRQGKSYALNKGIKEAKGKIVAFADDDCIVDREWLQNIWDCFKRYKCDGLGGRVLPLYPKNTPSWIRKNEDLLSGPIVSHNYGEEIKIYDLDKMVPAVGANMAFKKSCFKEAGLFREDIGAGKGMVGEDTEFFMRLMKKNKVLYYCGTALIWHKVEEKRMSLRYIGKWKFKGGRYLAFTDNNPDLICYFGIPRYLFKRMGKNIFSVLISSFSLDKRKFLKSYMDLLLNMGMIFEYMKKINY